MGRHTKKPETQRDNGPRWVRRVGKVPLLPVVAGACAIGVAATMVGTNQISLNFAGGSPSTADQGPPTASPHPTAGTQRASQDESGRQRASVIFRTTSSWGTGFRGTVTILNRGTGPFGPWTLVFRYPGTSILSAQGAQVLRLGTVLETRAPAAHPSIPPGDSYRVTFTARGHGAAPATCTINGRRCA